MKARPFLLIAFVVLAACQTYDFEPVKPLAATQYSAELELKAAPLPPNIMILLDKSDSMNTMIKGKEGRDVDGNLVAACSPTVCKPYNTTNPHACGPQCSTRINELRHAMKKFLDGSHKISDKDPRPLGKFGLTLFPIDKGCAASQKVEVPFAASDSDDALRNKINETRDFIFDKLYNAVGHTPIIGGTPTGDSLRFLLANAARLGLADEDRSSFILLLTDGLPNCNRVVANGGCPSTNDCVCTLSTNQGQCVNKTNECASNVGPGGELVGSVGCLDNFSTVKTIEELNARKIKTIVIGFGVDDLAGIDTATVLNAMARAGGFADTYYPAENQEELLAVLAKIREDLVPEPCVFNLQNAVSDPSLISVYVEDKRVTPGNNSYSYDVDKKAIVFVGDLCEQLKKSTHVNPVPLRITVLETL